MPDISIEHSLQLLLARTTATGLEYLSRLAQTTREVLQVEHVLVGRVVEPARDRVRVLVHWQGAGLAEPFEYALAGTPCAEVVDARVQQYPRDVQRHFPSDAMLAEFEAEAYYAVPLWNVDQCVGVLACLDSRPGSERPGLEGVLHVFGQRAAAVMMRMEEEPSAPKRESTRPPASRLVGVKMLVIDDQPMVRSVARQLLEMEGAEVDEAEDGAQGLAMLGASKPPGYDAVLLDLSMPGMNGAQVLAELRGRDYRMPVVVMSGYSDSEVPNYPAVSFLSKPFRAKELLQALLDAL